MVSAVPQIIDHPVVLEQLAADGLLSLYHNSGAFGFAPGEVVHARGWIGPNDPTIRPAAREVARFLPEPHAATLARGALRMWLDHLGGGGVWVMPMSHWAYELDFGSRSWLPDVLRSVGVDPAALEARHDGSALSFEVGEAATFESLLRGLLDGLTASDFMLAFPGRAVVCTVHHHRQLWWQARDAVTVQRLDAVVFPPLPVRREREG